MDDERFLVRWKGKELGRFTRSEIVSHLLSREWSVHHEVYRGKGWRPAGEFLQEEPEVEPTAIKEEQEDGLRIWLATGYICLLVLGGLLIWLLIVGENSWGSGVAVMIGLLGSACGLANWAQGQWEHGLVLVGGSVGFALAVMALGGAS